MSDAKQFQPVSMNLTGQQYQGVLERVLFSTLIGMPCCVFLFINSTMLFTLRSKLVFRETSRYILLYNLLFADTAQLAFSQLLYILAASRIILTYPLCGVLVMFTTLTNDISPLTLVMMSLERYVAVCYPLRHATIASIRNTGVAIIVVWSISLVNVLVRGLLLLTLSFKELESLQMKDVCSDMPMLLGPTSYNYDRAYTYFLFVLATWAIISSYIGVMVAARSASTDRASAQKARNTLLLHLLQLGLSLSSTMHTTVVQSVSTILPRLEIVRMKNVFYVFIYILPRCLTSLIYGLRDQTIRPALLYHLCCRLTINSPSKA
ncbi:odorant receptor 131-2-like [Echeneis naucrates]|nr:odorant receptor 131-2-like [Echeneis naucrates]